MFDKKTEEAFNREIAIPIEKQRAILAKLQSEIDAGQFAGMPRNLLVKDLPQTKSERRVK